MGVSSVYVFFSHQSRGRVSDLVAEHLDHMHYLNDILQLNIADLNEVLVDHLLNRLFVPLYVYSITKQQQENDEVILKNNTYSCVLESCRSNLELY